jgi:phenylacetyl-CoA:acceptor oxidoreductase 26-kDa subunit
MNGQCGKGGGQSGGQGARPSGGLSGRTAPWHQPNWDARAAGNFIFGGAGTGLIVFAALAHALAAAYRVPLAIGLALVGAGLVCVWAEIGRPFRAINVYRHAKTSWMTREAMLAPFLFASGAGAIWTGSEPLSWAAAIIALGYLTCQAQMIMASKGIPAWRSPQILPLTMLTGLSEGGSVAVIAAVATADYAYLEWLDAILIAVVFARGFAWYAYRSGLQRGGAPIKALAALAKIELPFALFGNWGPVVLLVIALAASSAATVSRISVATALAVLASGWLFKFVLITRAAYNQGFALPRLPVRGTGRAGAAVKPGWH